MATANMQRSRGVESIPIERLGEEIRASLLPVLSRSSSSLAKLTLKALGSMNLGGSGELVLTPEFVERFLITSGGSTHYKAVVQKLGSLAKVCDFALLKGYLEPSAFDVRPIPVPPHCDEDRPEFQAAERTRRRHTLEAGPTPGWDEVVRLIGHLKGLSGPWPGARLYMLAATVILAELSLTEAMALDQAAVDLSSRKLRIVARWGRRLTRDSADVTIRDPLAANLERWMERIRPDGDRCPFLFPNNMRSGPWEYYGGGRMGCGPGVALKAACRLAGTPDFTFRGLATFGRMHRDRLSNMDDSPFRVAPGDGVLAASVVTISQLAEAVLGAYDESQEDSRFWIGRIFKILLGMPTILTAADLTAKVLDDFRVATGKTFPERGKHMIYLHKICNDAIKLGHLDADPFLDRPGFNCRKARPLPPTTPATSADIPVTRRRRLSRVDLSRLLDVPTPSEDGHWRGTQQELDGELEAIESRATREVIATLIKLMPNRPSKLGLEKESEHGDAVNLLKGFAGSGTRLAKAVRLPGQGKRGYWIEVEIVP